MMNLLFDQNLVGLLLPLMAMGGYFFLRITWRNYFFGYYYFPFGKGPLVRAGEECSRK
jgi:hypothetical protein